MGLIPFSRNRRYMHRIFGGVCGLLAAAAIALAAYVHHLGPPPIDRADALSVTVLDRDDNLLRAFTTADGRWRLPLELNETDPRYLAMLIAYEDKAFRRHSGVDPRSILRAGLLLARHGRLMSGASTLTMQVARLLEGTHRKTAAGKLEQMVRAAQALQVFLVHSGNTTEDSWGTWLER